VVGRSIVTSDSDSLERIGVVDRYLVRPHSLAAFLKFNGVVPLEKAKWSTASVCPLKVQLVTHMENELEGGSRRFWTRQWEELITWFCFPSS
jgi:hypothetical protein